MSLYRAYGITISSELPLPELSETSGIAQITVKKSRLSPPPLQSTSIQRQGITAWVGGTPNAVYLRWPGLATFLAISGQELLVDIETPEVDPHKLNVYLLSEALGLVLHQRGLFLLHASAVSLAGRVAIFAGAPGAGKSTMAAAFSQRGYPILGDDMVAMDLTQSDAVMVYPGYPQVKIWPDSIQGLTAQSPNIREQLQPLFLGSPKQVMRPQDTFPDQPLPLMGCFILQPGQQFDLQRLKGQAAFLALAKFFPCPGQVLQGNALVRHQQHCLNFLKRIPIIALTRPQDFKVLQNWITTLVDYSSSMTASQIKVDSQASLNSLTLEKFKTQMQYVLT